MKIVPQVISSLSQKINAKLGGINSIIVPRVRYSTSALASFPKKWHSSAFGYLIFRRPNVFNEPVIIIGADLLQSPSGDLGKPSIAAVNYCLL